MEYDTNHCTSKHFENATKHLLFRKYGLTWHGFYPCLLPTFEEPLKCSAPLSAPWWIAEVSPGSCGLGRGINLNISGGAILRWCWHMDDLEDRLVWMTYHDYILSDKTTWRFDFAGTPDLGLVFFYTRWHFTSLPLAHPLYSLCDHDWKGEQIKFAPNDLSH